MITAPSLKERVGVRKLLFHFYTSLTFRNFFYGDYNTIFDWQLIDEFWSFDDDMFVFVDLIYDSFFY